MLLQFAVENHKSIRDRVVLSMLASDHVDAPGDRWYDVPDVGRVLKAAALYGANASGKTNLVDAWATLAALVGIGVRPGKRISVSPCKLSPDLAARPTAWEVVVFVAGRVWRYALEVDAARVLDERLDVRQPDGWVSVFERRYVSERVTPAVTWGSGLITERSTFFQVLGEGTRNEQPLLAEARERNAYELGPLSEYFFMAGWAADVFRDEPRQSGPDHVLISLCTYNGFRSGLDAQLRALDTGVEAILVSGGDDAVRERLRREEPILVDQVARAEELGHPIRLRFLHKGRVILDFDELSTGTQRLLHIACVVGHDLLGRGATLFLDEIDRSFHTALTHAWMRRTLQLCTSGGQLIFTTHDTNLLDAGVLGADGIWFVEKDADGATRLYSLAEFEPGELDSLVHHIEDGYLEGRFGGVPFIGGLERVGWKPAS